MKFRDFEAKNHIFMSPVKTALATPKTGFITEELIKYYERKAKGGVGAIILEPISVLKSGKEHPKQVMLDTDEHIEGLKKLVDTLHKYDTKLIVHLNHAGRVANPKASEVVKSSSAVKCPSTGVTPEELTLDEIKELIQAFKENAERAQKAGADGIEIQFGHGYIVHQFYSERLNKRDDEYGKDKFKFAREVLSAVKEVTNIPLILRISGSEFVEGGITDEHLTKIFALAEEFGVSIIHVGWGNACDSAPWYYNHMSLPTDIMDNRLKEIRKLTKIPIIAVGRMQIDERYKKLVDDGTIDGVVFGRQLIIDPDFPNKILSNSDDFVRCGGCLQGCLANVKAGKPINCIANPEVHSEFVVEKIPEKKKVAIIGAGPAGLFAGTYLSKKGYEVTIYEKNDYAGGQWVLAYRAPGKIYMKDTLEDIIRKTEKSVEIKYNTEVTPEMLKKENYDIIIVATGAKPFVPPIPGLTDYITGFDFFDGKKVEGKNVLVIGGGLIGLEAAEALVNEGKNVTVVELMEEVGKGMEVVASKLFQKNYAPKINIYTKTMVKEIKGKEVIVEKIGEGITSLGEFDDIVVTAGTKPVNELYEKLKEEFNNVYVIGDANKVGQIVDAISSAKELAEQL
ncbi:NADH:flavin oxidoreductase [Marinitoga piezophila KA3]|uniref:NADH:flavin oxidoreductase n=1 Tax=Marinitoga piezophila (strain DSM 14283 / JCM 11233 / KA3) TaxID=443254 RepID=H2J7P5_MARPK|nr:NAD(P)/FAD-dependent oxidoreductase [Marinitoga piezophila]AEX85386.1 NADH:flavin oxidoreductase [Marinitoga piezophila KA3]